MCNILFRLILESFYRRGHLGFSFRLASSILLGFFAAGNLRLYRIVNDHFAFLQILVIASYHIIIDYMERFVFLF